MSELEESPHDAFLDVRHRGEPFTGIGVKETDEWVAEYGYENGRGHGRCVTTYRTGQKSEEFWLEAGRPVGASWSWYATGQLRRYRRHEPPRVERFWGPHGVLLEELDEAHQLRRSWYPTGLLKRETRGGTSRVFTGSGALAWVRERPGRQPEQAERPWDGLLFVAQVVEAELDALAADPDLEAELLAFVHQQLELRPARGLSVLSRLLAHEDLWVRGQALQLVGAKRLDALEAVVRVHLQDERIPPPRWDERSQAPAQASSIAEQARRALEVLASPRP